MQTWTERASKFIFMSNDRKRFSSQSVWEINSCHQISYTDLTQKAEIFNLKNRIFPPFSYCDMLTEHRIALLEQNEQSLKQILET